MQSDDFVEGVSGWRMSHGLIEMYGGPTPIILGSLGEAEPEQPKFFIVVDGVTYINAAFVKESSVESQLSALYTIKTQVLNGKVVFAGLHIDDCDTRSEFEKARDAGAMDEYFAKIIGETQLFLDLNKRIEALEKGKEQVIADAKRGVAESILRDLEKDKSAGTLGDCQRRFGVCGIPFGGYTGMPLKGDYPEGTARSDDNGMLAEAVKDWQPGDALKADGVASAINAVLSASAELRHVAQLVVDVEGLEADFAKVVKDVLRSELLPGGLLHRSR